MHPYPIPIAFRVGLKCFLHNYPDRKKRGIGNQTIKWKKFVFDLEFNHGGGRVSSYSGRGGGGGASGASGAAGILCKASLGAGCTDSIRDKDDLAARTL